MASPAAPSLAQAKPLNLEGAANGAAPRLQVLGFLDSANERLTEELAGFQIQLTVATEANTGLHNLPSVVLIDGAAFEKRCRSTDLLAQLRNSQRGIVLLADQNCDSHLSYIEAGFDGIACSGRPAAELSGTLWIAHRQYCIRRELYGRIAALAGKIEQMKLIGQAKAVVAEQLNISEAAALRHLRTEARNRRRPLHQLASVVLEARRILGQTTSEAADDDDSSL